MPSMMGALMGTRVTHMHAFPFHKQMASRSNKCLMLSEDGNPICWSWRWPMAFMVSTALQLQPLRDSTIKGTKEIPAEWHASA